MVLPRQFTPSGGCEDLRLSGSVVGPPRNPPPQGRGASRSSPPKVPGDEGRQCVGCSSDECLGQKRQGPQGTVLSGEQAPNPCPAGQRLEMQRGHADKNRRAPEDEGSAPALPRAAWFLPQSHRDPSLTGESRAAPTMACSGERLKHSS